MATDQKPEAAVGKINPPADKPEAATAKKETVEVEKGLLETLLAKLDTVEALERKVSELEKSDSRLTYAADKKRLADFDSRLPEDELVRTCNISMLGDDVIVGWVTVKNEVSYDGHTGIVYSDQSIKLFFKGGNETIMRYGDFANTVRKVKVPVIKSGTDLKTKTETWTIQLPGGEELDMNVLYLN